MTNRFVKSSIHFHVICHPMFNELYDFILLCFVLYNFCHFSIFFNFYNHLFIDVYARNSWCVRLSRLRGESDRDRHASLPLAREAPRSRCRSHAFFYPRLLILFLQSPAPLLGKGSIKKEQPPHSSCSLIPKGFHYIYFIPYIYIGIRSSVLLLLPQELPREPLPFPFRSQPGRRRLLP